MPAAKDERGWPWPELGLLFLILLGVVRIAATYSVFNQTLDEPSHIACGMELLDKGVFRYEPKHPPLARVAAALGPYLAGVRSTGAADKYDEGNNILYSGDDYLRILTLARIGILPFFVAASLLVWFWAKELYSKAVALSAVFLFTMLPGVLANAGVATTDMAITATLTASLFAFHRWIERPTARRSLWLGVALGLSVASKLSAPLLLPPAFAGIAGLHWLGSRRFAPPGEIVPWPSRIAQMAAASFLVIWACYGFSVEPFGRPEGRLQYHVDSVVGAAGNLHDLTYWVLEKAPLPAVELPRGLVALARDAAAGHSAYLLGQTNSTGWWYFSLVVLAVKPPLAFLILFGVGAFATLRRRPPTWYGWAPLVCAFLILLVCLFSKITLGLRHLLPIVPLMAITAGYGLVWLWRAKFPMGAARVAALGLVVWLTTSSGLAHPDYLAYFNPLAGDHPEDYLVDCDLDWGQGLLALSDELRARHIPEISLSYFGTADPSRHNLPPTVELKPRQKATGWIAIGLTRLKMGRDPYHLAASRNDFTWLESYKPVTLIRKSIRLYYVAPENITSEASPPVPPTGAE